LVKNFSRPLKKRIDFERQNLIQDECRSFKLDLLIADYCFEISSEGELEQVRPLIEYYLKKGKRIEIIFASPSVEKKGLQLASEFKEQIRILRLPIASFAPLGFLFFQNLWGWVTAPTLLLCRYDFFPELLSFKFLGKKLILLSAASKKPSWFKNQAHQLFDLIIAANTVEARYFRAQYPSLKILSFDFRVPRIFKRLESAKITLNAVSELATYLNYLDSLAAPLKLIMGSAWESDLIVLTNELWANEIQRGNIHLLIVPHNLEPQSIIQLKKAVNNLMPEVPLYEISKGLEFDAFLFGHKPGIIILNLSGVLCEFYSQFSLAYVGGGYERSIHSVLEPFLAGCQVIVGPKIKRSTEYDFAHELVPDEIHLLNNPESFYNLVKQVSLMAPKAQIRANLALEADILMESIIKEIELC
jgi:3-deoxy-D-manno-octulosonic-acid transferase